MVDYAWQQPTPYLLIDTREKQKAITRIVDYVQQIGIEYEPTKLLFGDYMDYNRPGVVIDRKQTIAELAKNCTVEHERFKREMTRAQKAGAELIILVEQNRYYTGGRVVYVRTINDLIGWSNPRTIVTGEKVFRVLKSWCNKYPIRVEFCDKKSTGKRIIDIIYNGKK